MAPSAIVTKTSIESLPSKVSKPNGTKEDQGSLDAICHGPIKLPGIPTFPTFSTHRLWALNHLTALFRHWSRVNYTLGLSGHISVRDPEYPSLFWMNPLAIHFGLLKASDMLLLSDSPSGEGGEGGGEVILAGNAKGRPANKAGWAIHAAIHRRRGDVNAACHAHTENGVAWSATGERLSMINQDVCTLYGDALAVYGNYGGVAVGSALGEGEAIAEALGEKGKAAILRNHGLLCVGQTVDEAGFLFGLLDRSCGVELKARGAGRPVDVIAEKEAEFNFRMASRPDILFWEFQPNYDYEVAMSHDNFQDLGEEDLKIQF